MKAEGIHHVDLPVTSYRRSVLFYDVILLPLRFRKGFVKGEKVTYHIRGMSSIGIRPVKKRHIRNISFSYKRAGIHHLAISVKKREAVDGFYELLKRKRVRVLCPPR